MNKYYRITYEGNGIYDALKNKINDIEIWKTILSSNNINWLPKPPSYSFNNKSYFTELGYNTFNEKTLPIIIKYLDKEKIKIETYNNANNIVYSDIYQVVTKE